MIDLLVIAPHPDDESLGAGGLLRKTATAGGSTCVCTVTVADPVEYGEDLVRKKRDEALDAHKVLGVTHSRFLEFPTKALDVLPLDPLVSALTSCFKELQPSAIAVCSGGDLHADHRRIFEATLVATRPYSFRVPRLMTYEVPSSTEWGRLTGRSFEPNYFVDIHAEIESKVAALECYNSEICEPPHPRSSQGVRTYAQRWGQEVGLLAAEPYQILRMFR